jgi:hypothetical protein
MTFEEFAEARLPTVLAFAMARTAGGRTEAVTDISPIRNTFAPGLHLFVTLKSVKCRSGSRVTRRADATDRRSTF